RTDECRGRFPITLSLANRSLSRCSSRHRSLTVAARLARRTRTPTLHQELAVARGDRARRIVLPGNYMYHGDPTAELEDVGAGACGGRAGGAEIVDREVDRLRHAVGAALVGQPE